MDQPISFKVGPRHALREESKAVMMYSQLGLHGAKNAIFLVSNAIRGIMPASFWEHFRQIDVQEIESPLPWGRERPI